MELMPGYSMKLDKTWGWTIAVDDIDKQPCPACVGSGQIITDDGYDEDGNLTAEYEILCPRCEGVGKYKLEPRNDGTENG